MTIKGTLHSPKPQYYWSFTTRLVNVLSRALVGEVLPFCRDAVGVYYSLHRLGPKRMLEENKRVWEIKKDIDLEWKNFGSKKVKEKRKKTREIGNCNFTPSKKWKKIRDASTNQKLVGITVLNGECFFFFVFLKKINALFFVNLCLGNYNFSLYTLWIKLTHAHTHTHTHTHIDR